MTLKPDFLGTELYPTLTSWFGIPTSPLILIGPETVTPRHSALPHFQNLAVDPNWSPHSTWSLNLKFPLDPTFSQLGMGFLPTTVDILPEFVYLLTWPRFIRALVSSGHSFHHGTWMRHFIASHSQLGLQKKFTLELLVLLISFNQICPSM